MVLSAIHFVKKCILSGKIWDVYIPNVFDFKESLKNET